MTIGHLGGPAMAAAVMGDDAIAMTKEEHHLRIPVIGGERPAMAEHDLLTFAPILVVNFGAVFGLDRRHGEVSSLWMPGHPSEPVIGPARGRIRWRRPETTKFKLGQSGECW